MHLYFCLSPLENAVTANKKRRVPGSDKNNLSAVRRKKQGCHLSLAFRAINFAAAFQKYRRLHFRPNVSDPRQNTSRK